VIGTQNLFVTRTGLLIELQCGAHPAGRMIRRAETTAGGDRVQMVGAKHVLPVGQNPLVKGNGLLDLAFRQAGGGQLLASGHSVGMPWSLNAFPVS
jgi:hypothetical protein